MLSSCICSTLVSVCAMKGIPIGPLVQWGKDLTYYLTHFVCLVNWDIYTTLVVYVAGRTCLRAGYFTYVHLEDTKTDLGAKGDVGFLDLWSVWKKTQMELIFNPCGEFRWSPESPVSQIQSPQLHLGAPGIFWDLVRSVQMLKREWGAESNGKLPYLFNPW